MVAGDAQQTPSVSGGHPSGTRHLPALSGTEGVVTRQAWMMSDEVSYFWRGPVTDDEMVDLVESHGGRASAGWWDQIRAHSLGWVAARDRDGILLGFVNVAWDGGDHAFLIDTKTRRRCQRQGIGSEAVQRAAFHARAAGCEWLHVDFEPDLAPFYLDACGFRPTDAGLIHLYSVDRP